MPESVIDRDEAIVLLFNVADIAAVTRSVDGLLFPEDEGDDEEADED